MKGLLLFSNILRLVLIAIAGGILGDFVSSYGDPLAELALVYLVVFSFIPAVALIIVRIILNRKYNVPFVMFSLSKMVFSLLLFMFVAYVSFSV